MSMGPGRSGTVPRSVWQLAMVGISSTPFFWRSDRQGRSCGQRGVVFPAGRGFGVSRYSTLRMCIYTWESTSANWTQTIGAVLEEERSDE